MVEHPLMVRWVAGSIPCGEPIEVISCSNQFSTTGVTKAVVCIIMVDPLRLFPVPTSSLQLV